MDYIKTGGGVKFFLKAYDEFSAAKPHPKSLVSHGGSKITEKG